MHMGLVSAPSTKLYELFGMSNSLSNFVTSVSFKYWQ